MNLMKALHWRYAVREFSDDSIARQKKFRFDLPEMVTLL